jgi:hypothetical protein
MVNRSPVALQQLCIGLFIASYSLIHEIKILYGFRGKSAIQVFHTIFLENSAAGAAAR